MSKPTDFLSEDDLPPSYTESFSPITITPLSPSATGSHLGPGFSSTPLLNPLSTHLRNLPSYIRQTQSITANTQADRDLDLLHHILPHVEDLLLSPDIGTSRSGLTELVLVPVSAVDRRWGLSGVTERRREGDAVRVGRVEVLGEKGDGEKGEKEKGKRKVERGRDDGDEEIIGGMSANNTEFSDWGRWDDGTARDDTAGALLWWNDEAMARRLAAYLQPKEQVKTERKEVQAAVEQKKKEKSLFGWARKKSEADTSSRSPASPGLKSPVERAVGQRDDRISMKVRADEVTFRRENDFGVWESINGFGIVVTIRVKKT